MRIFQVLEFAWLIMLSAAQLPTFTTPSFMSNMPTFSSPKLELPSFSEYPIDLEGGDYYNYEYGTEDYYNWLSRREKNDN